MCCVRALTALHEAPTFTFFFSEQVGGTCILLRTLMSMRMDSGSVTIIVIPHAACAESHRVHVLPYQARSNLKTGPVTNAWVTLLPGSGDMHGTPKLSSASQD